MRYASGPTLRFVSARPTRSQRMHATLRARRARRLFAAIRILLTGTLAAIVSAQVCAREVDLIGKSIVIEKALTFAVGPASKFANTFNERTHEQAALTTCRDYQYVTYFDATRRLCIGRRKLPRGSWKIIHFKDHRFQSNDSHKTSVIGICDKEDTIHVAFDHHATPLNYPVSQLGVAHHPKSFKWNAELFGDVTHSLGSVETAPRVTYPSVLLGTQVGT